MNILQFPFQLPIRVCVDHSPWRRGPKTQARLLGLGTWEKKDNRHRSEGGDRKHTIPAITTVLLALLICTLPFPPPHHLANDNKATTIQTLPLKKENPSSSSSTVLVGQWLVHYIHCLDTRIVIHAYSILPGYTWVWYTWMQRELFSDLVNMH